MIVLFLEVQLFKCLSKRSFDIENFTGYNYFGQMICLVNTKLPLFKSFFRVVFLGYEKFGSKLVDMVVSFDLFRILLGEGKL